MAAVSKNWNHGRVQSVQRRKYRSCVICDDGSGIGAIAYARTKLYLRRVVAPLTGGNSRSIPLAKSPCRRAILAVPLMRLRLTVQSASIWNGVVEEGLSPSEVFGRMIGSG